MKIAVVGSRNYSDLRQVQTFVKSLPAGTIIVSGGARGVDQAAEHAARLSGFPTMIFPADWSGHGRRAGFLRNAEIVAAADKVVAFWDGRSPGTRDTIDRARAAGKAVEIHYDGCIWPQRAHQP